MARHPDGRPTIDAPNIDEEPRVVERQIIQVPNGNGGWNSFKNWAFLALVAGLVYVIWNRQQRIDDREEEHDRILAELKLKCPAQPTYRGASLVDGQIQGTVDYEYCESHDRPR